MDHLEIRAVRCEQLYLADDEDDQPTPGWVQASPGDEGAKP
jgi:hypothetical protein